MFRGVKENYNSQNKIKSTLDILNFKRDKIPISRVLFSEYFKCKIFFKVFDIKFNLSTV